MKTEYEIFANASLHEFPEFLTTSGTLISRCLFHKHSSDSKVPAKIKNEANGEKQIWPVE